MPVLATVLGVVALLAPATQPSTAPSTQPARIGRYQISYDKPHDLASQREGQKRFRWNDPPQPMRLADETFQVYVPDSYTPDQKFGLFVWVSPQGRGGVPCDWLAVLDEKKLIWIGPDNIGNQRHIDHRCRLVVEAMLYMRETYNIDPDRVYVGGFSGGGKIAAMSAINYTELFTGAFSICGPIFYRNIPTGLKKDEFYPQGYYPPPPAALKTAKTKLRHVLLTGSEDFNLQPTERIYEVGYMKEGFKNVLKIIVPGLDRSLPSGEFFKQGIEFLDTKPVETAPTTRPVRHRSK